MQKQRHLISEAKFLLKQKEHELKNLKREMYYLEQFILNDGYIEAVRANNRHKKSIARLRNSKKNSLLKAAINFL